MSQVVEVIQAYSDPNKPAPDARIRLLLREDGILMDCRRTGRPGQLVREVWLFDTDLRLFQAALLKMLALATKARAREPKSKAVLRLRMRPLANERLSLTFRVMAVPPTSDR